MRLKSLVPFREPGQLVRPDFGLFGPETDKAIEVSAEMPGLERKDVEISIEGDTLTIRGEKKSKKSGRTRTSAQRAELRRILSRAAVASRR